MARIRIASHAHFCRSVLRKGTALVTAGLFAGGSALAACSASGDTSHTGLDAAYGTVADASESGSTGETTAIDAGPDGGAPCPFGNIYAIAASFDASHAFEVYSYSPTTAIFQDLGSTCDPYDENIEGPPSMAVDDRGTAYVLKSRAIQFCRFELSDLTSTEGALAFDAEGGPPLFDGPYGAAFEPASNGQQSLSFVAISLSRSYLPGQFLAASDAKVTTWSVVGSTSIAPFSGLLASGNSSLWLRSGDDQLARLDPTTAQATAWGLVPKAALISSGFVRWHGAFYFFPLPTGKVLRADGPDGGAVPVGTADVAFLSVSAASCAAEQP